MLERRWRRAEWSQREFALGHDYDVDDNLEENTTDEDDTGNGREGSPADGSGDDNDAAHANNDAVQTIATSTADNISAAATEAGQTRRRRRRTLTGTAQQRHSLRRRASFPLRVVRRRASQTMSTSHSHGISIARATMAVGRPAVACCSGRIAIITRNGRVRHLRPPDSDTGFLEVVAGTRYLVARELAGLYEYCVWDCFNWRLIHRLTRCGWHTDRVFLCNRLLITLIEAESQALAAGGGARRKELVLRELGDRSVKTWHLPVPPVNGFAISEPDRQWMLTFYYTNAAHEEHASVMSAPHEEGAGQAAEQSAETVSASNMGATSAPTDAEADVPPEPRSGFRWQLWDLTSPAQQTPTYEASVRLPNTYNLWGMEAVLHDGRLAFVWAWGSRHQDGVMESVISCIDLPCTSLDQQQRARNGANLADEDIGLGVYEADVPLSSEQQPRLLWQRRFEQLMVTQLLPLPEYDRLVAVLEPSSVLLLTLAEGRDLFQATAGYHCLLYHALGPYCLVFDGSIRAIHLIDVRDGSRPWERFGLPGCSHDAVLAVDANRILLRTCQVDTLILLDFLGQPADDPPPLVF
ncbi:hypothetical protein THASP1DRAFT_27019 [Thamnocephalis sphaerospora]|uniref:Uncharacterized protein n=1 Tax=Thamnocephalis sphaerospora TaxID=78915 RepID=A0A4P9XXK7_9FUNG|nr:hypothetical protein THASP1DRAFT_27019 [Thamnocephalis sphaerospora]|eukprot:RKP11183.1 hypothetical protein THASP1DRAFT_27019 [Thamnocephalis sphaerospora]